MSDGPNLAAARAAWPVLPDWVEALAIEADATSQVRVADVVGMSAGAINQVLRNKYQAATDRIEQRVRGTLLRQTVPCPELGDLAADLCLENERQARTWSDASSHRIRMQRACRACPRARQ